MIDEGALIRRAVLGDRGALGSLIHHHRPAVHRIARSVLGDGVAVDDVTQDVFLRLQRSLGGFRSEAELGTWLYRVTLNACRDHLRRRRRRMQEVDLDDAGAAQALQVEPSGGRSVELEWAREAIERVLQRLPEEQRTAVSLRYFEGLGYAEIALKTGIPQGTIASRVFRALERIGRELEPGLQEILE